MKAKGLVFYWALVLCATGVIIALVAFMESDTFKYGLAVGADLGSVAVRWFLRGMLILIVVWFVERTIANGVAKGIAQAKAAEEELAAKKAAAG